MGRLLRLIVCVPVLCAAIAAPARAADKVALRAQSGRFLRAAEDGSTHADRLLPAQSETFELLPREGELIALRAANGRFLVAEGRDARTLRADTPRAEPGDRETFAPAHLDQRRVALKARGYRDFIVFDAAAAVAPRAQPERPIPAETVEIYRISQIPANIQAALATAIRGLAMEELGNKEYDKVTSELKEEYIELPAPTWRNPRETKRHRVLWMREEVHVQARLDGPPEVRITRMPYLRGYSEPGHSVLMFGVEASVPVRGSVQYTVPNMLSASSGFRATVALSLVGEVQAEKSGDQMTLDSPKLLDVHVELRSLDIANDVLHVMRGQIRDLVNREIGKNQDRIHQQANEALRKAVAPRQFQSPLLLYLSLP